MKGLFVTVILMITTAIGWASDLAREKRFAEQISDAILDGEPIRLESAGQPFFAIHTPSPADQVLGGVILLHGMGVHPDWGDVIQPLRVSLPEHGWETLSIQLPIAASDATIEAYLPLIADAKPRIHAAVDYLVRERKIHNIMLVGHSLGARMGLEYAATAPPNAIQGLVTIGLSGPDQDVNGPVAALVAKLGIPVLDLYGNQDLERVIRSSQWRKAATAQASKKNFKQLEIEGADHFFHDLNEILESSVSGWLRVTAKENQDRI